MKNVSRQKEASKSCLPQHGHPLPSLCTEKLMSWQPVPLGDLWYASLSSVTLFPLVNGEERGGWCGWIYSRSRQVGASPTQAVGSPAWKRQLQSRGRRSILGQVPRSQDKPTLRLQVVTGRKTPVLLCEIELCWPSLAAWLHSLKGVLTRHIKPNASCLFLNQCSVLQPVTVICVLSAIPPPPSFPSQSKALTHIHFQLPGKPFHLKTHAQ